MTSYEKEDAYRNAMQQQQQQGIPVVVAQPAGQPYGVYPNQASYSQSYPQSYPQPTFAYDPNNPGIQQQQQQGGQQQVFPNRPPPPGYWGSNICDWPRNLFPSCWCACCCLHGSWLIGQMSQRVGFASFRTIFAGYVAMWVIVLIVTFISVSSAVVWLPFLFILFVNIGLRLHIVRTKEITECGHPAGGFGNLMGECCCGLWCSPCAIAQQARYLYGYISVFDGDANIDRKPQYDIV